MSEVLVRPFHRADRDQVTALVNAHIAAVVPNVSVSVQTLLSQLEREPGEFIVDPWVRERRTLVAEQRDRVVAAAHLLRYGDDTRVNESYRDAGEIRWLVAWPDAPYWPDATDAAHRLAAACVAQLARWQVRRCYADGDLPAPGVYGVPEQWPHVHEAFRRLGFTSNGNVETIHLARVDELPRLDDAVLDGVTAVRALGVNGTRFTAVRDGETLGCVELDTNLDDAARTSRTGGWADVGNLHVEEAHRRRGVGTWLLAQAADWLRLGGVTCLLDYTEPGDEAAQAFLHSAGFRVLTRTTRDYALDTGGHLPARGPATTST